MQFKLTDMMRLTAYFAVAAWLYSLGIQLGVLVWVGTVFGFEIGIRSRYPNVLMAACGTVFGMALSMAVLFTGYETSATKVFIFLGLSLWQILLAVVWLTAAGIFAWMVTRIERTPARAGPTRD